MAIINNKIIFFDELDSTNAKMKELSVNGAESGLVIRAGYQTGGRGRMGRNWESARGDGLYMSILLRKSELHTVSAPALLSLATGLGVRNAVASFIKTDIGIKWPNDIISGRRKVSGILVETAARGNEIDYYIIGIGVNVNTKSFSQELEYKATSFFIETNKKFDINEVAEKIIIELDDLYIRCANGDNTWLNAYISHCAGIGEQVKIISVAGETIGMALGVNHEGELIVETSEGKINFIRAGEVSIRGMNGYI